MDGMQYTPILGEPNLGDSWASSSRALVSMLEDTQLNAKNLGKAAELLGDASDEAIEIAAQAREITKAQKDAITWMNKQIKEQTGLVTKEIVNSTKQMFASIAQKTGGLSPSVVQEATRTLVHPLMEKIVGGLSASEIGKYAMSLVDQGLGLKNLNRYSSGYRAALEGIGKNFQGAIESSKALKEQFDNIRKILSETTLADFSESTGSQKVNRAIADFLKTAGVSPKPLTGKDLSGGARSVTRVAANIAAKSFRTESEAEKQILALFGDNKISEAGRVRAKQAAKYAANMQRNSGQNVEIVREKGSNEIKVLVYGADARDKSGRVDRRKAAAASFAITGADKRVEDYMIVNGKKMSVSDAKAQYLVDMSSRRVPQNVAATRAKIREINQQTSFKSPSQYEREDNLRGTGADKKLTESRVRFDKEVERLVNIEKALGSTLTNRQLENYYGQLIMLSAGHKQSDPGIKAMLNRFQKDYGLSTKGIKAFTENFSWLPMMGAMSEEDLTNMRLWDLKAMQDKMALVTRKIQSRDIMPYANVSKPGQAQNIEIDLSRLFDEKGEVNTAFANQAKDVKAAAEIVKKYKDTLEGLADGIALVSGEQIKNLDVVREDVSIKLSEEEFKDIAKKLKIDSKSLRKSTSLKKIYGALLSKEGRTSTNERVRFSRDEETGAIELTGNELVKAHTGTKINSAYGNLRNVLRAVPPELIEALSVITGVDLMDGKSSRATVISAREGQLSSRNIGPMVTRVIANTIDELGTKDIKQEVDKIDTSNLTKGLAEAILGVLTNKLSFDEALEKYAGSNVKARTKMTGEALWLMDQLTGGRKGYRLEDNKLVTDRIATSYMDIIGTRVGEYFPHGAATLPTNWEVEDLLRSARMAGVSVQDPEKLRRLQMMSFGATTEDINERNRRLENYQESIRRNQGLLNSRAGLNANYIAQQDDGNLIVVGQSGLYGNQEHFINIDALRRTRKLDNGQTDVLQRAEETIWGKLEAQLTNIDKTQARILVDLGADMGEARYLELNKDTKELGDYNDTLEDLLIAVQQGESPEEKKRLLAEVFKSEAYNYENTGGALNAQFLAKMAKNQEEARRAAAIKYGSSLASGVFYGENTNITDIDVSKETNEELKRRIKETGAYIDQEHVRGQVALDLSKYTKKDWRENTLAYLEFFGKNSKGDWSEVLKNVKSYKDAVDFVTNALTVGTAEHSALYGGSNPLLTRGLSGAIGRQPYSQAINAQFGGMLFGKQGLGLNVLESNRGLNQLIKGDFDGDKLLVALNSLIQTAKVMGESDEYVQKLRNLVAKVEDYNASMYKIVGATSKAVAPNSEAQSTVLDFEGAEVLNEQQLGWVRAFQNQAKNKTGNWSNIAKGVRNVLELQGLGTGTVLDGDQESAVKFTQGSVIFEALEQLEQDAISAKKLWSTAVNAMKNAKGAELDQMTEEEFGATLNEYLENAMIKLIDDVYKGKSSISDVIRISGGQGIFKNDSLDAVRSSRILGTLAKSEGLNTYDAIERALGKDNADLQLIAKKVGGESATWASLAGDKESFKKILLSKLEKGAFDDFGFSLSSILSIAEEMPDDLLEKGRQEHGRFRRETGPVMSGTAAGDLINSINRLSTNYTKAIEGSNAEIVNILEEIRNLLEKQGRGGLNERYGKTYLTPTGITASLNPYYADESPSGYLQGKILGFKDSNIDWTSLSLKEKASKFGYTNTKQFEKDRESVVSTFIGTLAHAFSESQVKNNPNLFSEAEETFKKNLSMLFNEKEVAKYLAIAQEYGRRGYGAYNRLAGPDAYRAAEENVRLKEDDYIVKGKTDAIYTSKRLNEKGEEYQIFNILDFKNKAKIGLDSIEQVVIYVEMYRRIKQELDDMIRSGTGEKIAYEKMSKQTLLSEDTLRALHESLDVSAQIVQNYGGKTKVYDIANAPRDIAYALTHGFSLTKDQEKKLENAATASPQLTQTASAEFQAAYKAATGEAFGVEDYKKISVSYEEKLAEERALKEQLSKAEQGSGKDSVLYQKLAAYYEELRKEIGELDEQRNQLAQELSLGRGVRAGATRYARKEVKHSLEMGELGFGYDKILKADEKQRLLAQKQREASIAQIGRYNTQIAKTEQKMLELDKQTRTTTGAVGPYKESTKTLIEQKKQEIDLLIKQRQEMIKNSNLSKSDVETLDQQLSTLRLIGREEVKRKNKGANSWLDMIGSGIKTTITRMFDYNGVYRVLNKLSQSLQKVVNLAKELDNATFNIQVVTGQSREETSSLITEYRKLGDQLGATTIQIANAANEWLRQGYNAQQANELITASTYLSKLGMIEAGQATTYLTSMIKGFKLEVTDAINVVSKLTAVDMEAAASAGGIAAALQNVATTAQLAGVSLDETIAYATTIIETTQRDASSVGMALRTIMSRYGNVKAGAYTKMNLEASSDTDLENLNDIEKVLNKIGISIRLTNTEFRDFSDVLDELGDKWATLDNVSKNAIATAMAGVRQREQFLVLMENLDRVAELEEVSKNSAGTAEQKYAAYMETIESAQNRLNNAWSELAQQLEESGIVKFFTDLAIVLTQAVIPALTALGSALIAYNGYKIPTLLGNLGKRGLASGGLLDYGKENGFHPIQAARAMRASRWAQKKQWKEENRLTYDKSTGELSSKKQGFLSRYVDDEFGKVSNEIENTFGKIVSSGEKVAETFKNVVVASEKQKDTTEEVVKAEQIRQDATESNIVSENQETQANVQSTRSEQEETKANLAAAQSEGGGSGPIAKAGERLKSQLSDMFSVGLSAAYSGAMTGLTTEGSDKAKLAAGGAATGLTLLGGGLGALAGVPQLGAMLGSTIGSFIAKPIADWIDREEINRKERVETASKQLSALKAQQDKLDEIASYAKVDNLTSEDISTIKEYVASIRDSVASGEGVTFRTNLQNLISSDLLKKLGYNDFESLYKNLEYALSDEKLPQSAREQLASVMNLANVQAERDAYYRSMEEKRHSGMDYDERLAYEKKLGSYDIQAAYLQSGVERMSTQELARIGVSGAAKQVAATLYGIDTTTEEGKKQFDNLVVSNDLLRQITALMKQSNSNSVQNLMAGQVYTLKDVLNRDTNLSDEARQEQLEKFASALGVSLETVGQSVDAFGTFTLGELNSSFSDLKEAADSLISRFDKLSKEGSLGLEDYLDIVSSNTGEAAALGLGEEYNYAERIHQTANLLTKNTQDKWIGNTEVWKALTQDKELWGEEGFDEKAFGGAFEGVKSYEQAYPNIQKRLQALQEEYVKASDERKAQIQEEYNNLVNINNKMVQNQTNAFNKIGEAGAEYEKEILLNSIQSHLEQRLDREIEALNEQKSALEQINNQHEYENKLIEAKLKLENAQNEKKKVWREGIGWVYEADTSAIADAQKELEDLDNEKEVNKLQTQIDELQAQKDWMSDFLESENFKKAEEFMKSWNTNIGDTRIMISEWQNAWSQDEKTPAAEIGEKVEEKVDLAKDLQRKQIKEAEKQLKGTEAYKLIQQGIAEGKTEEQIRTSLSALSPEQIETYSSALQNYQNAVKEDKLTDVEKFGGTQVNLSDPDNPTEEKVEGATDKGIYDLSKTYANITPGYGRTAHVSGNWNATTNPNKAFGFNYKVQVTGRLANEDELSAQWYGNTQYMNGKGTWTGTRKYKHFSTLKEQLTNRLLYNKAVDKYFYIGSDHRIYEVDVLGKEEDTKANKDLSAYWYAAGTLSAAGGVSMVNDDPQYGLEGIITPQGTLTALPSKSGVVPADMTRNVWQLGEVAPNLIKQLVDINGKFNSPLGFGTDESFNVDHLDVHMVAQPGFDMDDFVRKLRAARDLSKHS